MKSIPIPFVLIAMASPAFANTAPTVVIQSAAMRPGTTLMDVVYRVNDPDDATVKVRALAFIDGTRSFAKVIRPTTFVEGTESGIGDAITANAVHTLTWDVAADWNIDVGQVKFEILALDSRGLLQLDWISIPAAGGQPALTISKDTPASNKVLDALFWQYASGDTGLGLASGALTGTAESGNFAGLQLANGSSPNTIFGARYVFKRMNLDPADSGEMTYANLTARAGLLNTGSWHALDRAYVGIDAVVGWGSNEYGQTTTPGGLSGVTAIAVGDSHSLALMNDGTVVAWGSGGNGQTTIPAGLSGVRAIAAGGFHNLAIKSDGTVVGWGLNVSGQTTIPAGLSGVTAIAAGKYFSLALKIDGTVVGWGDNTLGVSTIPAGLSGVTAIAGGDSHSLALKSNGTVVGWGDNYRGQITIPAGLSGVTAIAAGGSHSLALKNDGTVVGWGWNGYYQITIPTGLSGVRTIAAGTNHSLALKIDGTVVGWGDNSYFQTNSPAGLSGMTAIATRRVSSLALKTEAP